MVATSALPAIAPALPAGGAPRAEPLSADAAADFAGLIGFAVAAPSVQAQTAAADEPIDTGSPAEGEPTDPAAGATPPLLNWLFGLMASTGAAQPAAAGAGVAEPGDAATQPLPAGVAPTAPRRTPNGLLTVAVPQAAMNDDVPVEALQAQAQSQSQSPAFGDLPLQPVPVPVAEEAPVAADARRAAMPLDLPMADASPLSAPAAPETPALTPESAAVDVLRDLAQARPAHAADAALLPAPAAPDAHRAPASTGASSTVVGNALSLLAADFVVDLGERIEWQVADGISEAKIELHPAELGALTVRIETRDNEARVHIVAAEAATRSLLNQAMPQLRELFAGSGMNLARSQVDSGDRREGRMAERAAATQAGAGVRRRITQLLLVDAYA